MKNIENPVQAQAQAQVQAQAWRRQDRRL
ncbi:hypothetical protein EYA88_09170 [Burkholderia pseudomallei]|nr:hypothetical protein EYA88_09170 [Burkholderia pseudomallei]